MLYLQHLSEVVGRLFYEHDIGDDIGESTAGPGNSGR